MGQKNKNRYMNNKDRKDKTWQSQEVITRFLSGVRASIPLAKEQLDVMMHILTANGNDINNFLDFGCGNAILSQVILDKFPNANGICLDFSEGMLEQAKKNLGSHVKQVKFYCLDYSNQEYLDTLLNHGSFDAVVSGFSIHHQTDKRKKEIYKEIYDLLKTGGFFINIEHVKSPTSWVESLWNEAFISSYAHYESKKEKGKTRDKIAYDFFNDPSWIKEREANILAPVEEQCSWLRDIGYENVDCFLKIYELAVFGGQKSF